jgi:hypothetical protein
MFCIAAQPFGGLRTYTSGTWSGIDGLRADAYRTACAGSQLCVATGFSGALYDYDGQSWTNDDTVSSGVFTSATCASPTFCAGILWDGVAYMFNGVTWGLDFDEVSLDEQEDGSLISCPTTSMCIEMGEDGGIASLGRA